MTNTWNSHYAGKVAGTDLRGYVAINLDGFPRRAHRLAWLYVTGEYPADEIDHIDRNRANNRFENLRQATMPENQRNRAVNSNNQSGLKGAFVYHDRFEARIMVDKVTHKLGTFDTAQEAHEAYCEAALRLHNDYACTD